MNKDMREEWDRRLDRWLTRIQRLHKENAPDFLIAKEITHLFFTAISYLGKDVAEELGKRLVEDGRRWIGRGQEGDNGVDVRRTYLPLCGTCEGKANAEYLRMAMDLDEEEGE